MDNDNVTTVDTHKMNADALKTTGLGARLRKSREAMHLTQKEAAARLYLNPKIVEVIENEAFFEGPPLTFMRGYLRSYARLLNLPESEVKTAIDSLEGTLTPIAPITPLIQTAPIYRGDRYLRWITYLIVITLISLVILWWSSHSKYVITDLPAPTVNVPETTTTTDESTITIPTLETEAPAVLPPEPDHTGALPIVMPPATHPLFITLPDPLSPQKVGSTIVTTNKPAPRPKKPRRPQYYDYDRQPNYQPIANMETPEPE